MRRGASKANVLLAEHNPDCERCKTLAPNTMNVCMLGVGPVDADIMLVGEAPGQNEDDDNEPFVGDAGEYLNDDILPSTGLIRKELRLTNSCRCHPPKNKTPSITYIENCREYLEAEITRINPKVIVGMGNVPLASILRFKYASDVEEGTAKSSEGKVSGITKWQGKPIWLQEFKCWFIPTFHPSYAMRNSYSHSEYSTNLIIEDLKRAGYYSNKSRPSYRLPRRSWIHTEAEALSVLSKMAKSEAFAFDIETGGKGRPCDKYIIGCSFANSSKQGYYIEWDILKSPAVYMRFVALMTSKKHKKVMHNGAYEVKIFKFNDIPIYDSYFDTMTAAHLLDENFEKKLKSLAWIHTNFGGYDLEVEKYKREHRIKEDYSLIPVELLAPYAAMDAIVTWILYEKFQPMLEKEKVWPLFNKIVMPVRRVMSDAEYNGLKVDTRKAKRLADTCDETMKRLEDKIYNHAGEKFNLNSPKQLQVVLFDNLKFVPLKETKTGFSTDAETIDLLKAASPHPILDALSDRSYLKTMYGTHISQALSFVWEDGRVHTSYNQTGTVTGRTSCSQPSLHNVPQDALVRSLYMASPGCWIVEADLKQAELAYLAAESGEEALLRAFEEGLDVHTETARIIFDLADNEEPTKLQRRDAKTINFGLVYGMTAKGLARRLGITEDEAEAFMERYFDRMPKVSEYMEQQKDLVKDQGYVRSLFMRKRRIPLGLSDKWGDIARAERQAMNSPIQSGAADYTYLGLVRLRRALIKERLKAMIVHTVHDCVLTDTPKVEVNKVRELTRTAFETPVKVIPVQMRVDVEVHKRWGESNESRLKEIIESVGLAA